MAFGPLVGALAAFFGHLLSDMINGYGFRLNWYIASALSMGITGLAYFYTKFKDGECRVKDIIIFNIFQLIGQCLAFGIFATAVDVYLYAEPWNKVIAQGFVASLVNSQQWL